MGCKKHNYSRIDVGFNGDYNDMSMKDLAKEGNKSISEVSIAIENLGKLKKRKRRYE